MGPELEYLTKRIDEIYELVRKQHDDFVASLQQLAAHGEWMKGANARLKDNRRYTDVVNRRLWVFMGGAGFLTLIAIIISLL